jgi:predicted RNase H-like nuclease
MNGDQPLRLPKKIKGRACPDGMALRAGLLEAAGFPLAALVRPAKSSGWGEDDLMDACACAWSARRLAMGRGLRLPDNPVLDARGLRMEICA